MTRKITIHTATDQKRWEELHKIRSLPISIAEKRLLKSKLKNLPVVELKGMKRFRWYCRRIWNDICRRWNRQMRKHVVWQRSLQEIEVRGGTSIVNVFLFIKWAVYFNLFLFLIVLGFIILPYMITEKVKPSAMTSCPANFTPARTPQDLRLIANQTQVSLKPLAECCLRDYYKTDMVEMGDNFWTATSHGFRWSVDGFTFTPFTYGFYHQYEFKLQSGVYYNFQQAYLLVPLGIFVLSLMTMVWQIGIGIKEMTLSREGEFYKFSNLVFAGWDHYTKDKAGAGFKQKILLNEMKIALQTEKLKVRQLSKKKKFRLLLKRILANVLVLFAIFIIGVSIYLVADYSIRRANNTADFNRLSPIYRRFINLLPAIFINLANAIFPIFLKRVIRKLERYSHEVHTTITLIRALFVRVLAIAFAAIRYYFEDYCEKAPNSCILCENELDPQTNENREKSACWESVFGVHIYTVIIVDLVFKIGFVLGVGYGKILLGKLTKLNFLLSVTKFNIIRHSLDIIYIQSLSWFFYFAPFLPLFVTFYCIVVGYLKKFNLMVLSQAAPDTFRTTRTTAVFVATKLIAFVAVSLAIGFVLTTLEPSRSCGPFRGAGVPWDVIASNQSEVAVSITSVLGSPGVAIPIVVIMATMSYFYYSTAQAHRRMVETLRHILILEGHDKQYLFERLNVLRDEAAEQLLLSGDEEQNDPVE